MFYISKTNRMMLFCNLHSKQPSKITKIQISKKYAINVNQILSMLCLNINKQKAPLL